MVASARGSARPFSLIAPRRAPVPVFVHTAKHFRVPEDPATPVIMVGPGTGIAPFRAFLQERKAAGATGKNWLFFGDQKAATDFLYQEELEAYQQEGILHQLAVAFSRDQAEKVYVQHRMLEQAEELYAWLEAGCLFLCLRRCLPHGQGCRYRPASRSSRKPAANLPRRLPPMLRS
jgi:sulfite reductase (NADPH) flavoprotein alpha-component